MAQISSQRGLSRGRTCLGLQLLDFSIRFLLRGFKRRHFVETFAKISVLFAHALELDFQIACFRNFHRLVLQVDRSASEACRAVLHTHHGSFKQRVRIRSLRQDFVYTQESILSELRAFREVVNLGLVCCKETNASFQMSGSRSVVGFLLTFYQRLERIDLVVVGHFLPV